MKGVGPAEVVPDSPVRSSLVDMGIESLGMRGACLRMAFGTITFRSWGIASLGHR